MQFKQQEHGYSDKYNITTLPPQAKRDRKVCPGCRCHPAQQLKSLLSTARNTEWGLKHDYKSIQGYADFCERIPLQTYDDIKPYVTRMINGERNILWPSVVRWYAKSSGTTNDKSKFLPVTPEILKGCHYKGGFDTVSIYLQNNPDSHFSPAKG